VLFITEASGGFEPIYRSFTLLNDRGRMEREKDKDGGWDGGGGGFNRGLKIIDVFSDYYHVSITVTWIAWLFVCTV